MTHAHDRDAVDIAFDELVAAGLERLTAAQTAFAREIEGYARWDMIDRALVVSDDAKASRSWRTVPIGTYVRSAEQFAWAWANESFSEAERTEAARIRLLSDATGYAIFTTAHFDAPPSDLDALRALALHALDAHAVFTDAGSDTWTMWALFADEDPGTESHIS